jgi:hypothetical protein
VGLFAAVKKAVSVAYLGGTALDLEERERGDRKDGVERLTDTSWGPLVTGGDEEDVWVVIMSGAAVMRVKHQLT